MVRFSPLHSHWLRLFTRMGWSCSLCAHNLLPLRSHVSHQEKLNQKISLIRKPSVHYSELLMVFLETNSYWNHKKQVIKLIPYTVTFTMDSSELYLFTPQGEHLNGS